MRSANWSISLLTIFFVPASVSASSSIVNSKHNLSVSGPGQIKATSETKICVFCHTPHNAHPQTPLWNRELDTQTYTLYQSSTMSSTPSQPNGPTRLCLSCHDGTIALGDFLHSDSAISMTGQITSSRASYLGTDISDDHPVSFNYAEALPNPELAAEVPAGIKTYGGGNIHCTTCHDPHDDSFGKFLVMSNNYSALCTTCHSNKSGWSNSTHRTSSKTWDPPGTDKPAKTVAEHGCESCHLPHSAGGPKRLLWYLKEEDNCYSCHDGNVASHDIESQFNKTSKHPIAATTIDVTGNYHDAAESVSYLQNHVECVDCHNPHASKNSTASSPNASGRLAMVKGKNLNSSVVTSLTYTYELCFKCHGDSGQTTPRVTRWNNENNVIVEFSQPNPSYHPVTAPGKNSDMPSLPSSDEPSLSVSSYISCVDCHDSNESTAIGGSGPVGPHGSIYSPILRQRYDTTDNQAENSAIYALCYRCHNRTNILQDLSFQNNNGNGGHKKHLQQVQAPCSACHDPHGVQADGNGDHTHLINFDSNIVSKYGSNSAPIFNDNGYRSGSCTLVCHGEDHNNYSYP